MADVVDMTDAELDAAVAERVMGWQPGGVEYRTDGTKVVWFKPEGWSPTTDANAMMEVVEKAREQGLHININAQPRSSWLVILSPRSVLSASSSSADEPTIGRAVCIAALRAVEK